MSLINNNSILLPLFKKVPTSIPFYETHQKIDLKGHKPTKLNSLEKNGMQHKGLGGVSKCHPSCIDGRAFCSFKSKLRYNPEYFSGVLKENIIP